VNFLSPINKILPKEIKQALHIEHIHTQVIEESELAKAYVILNMVEATSGRKCVDGRYMHSQSVGMIARPGGDFGYVMALMRVNHEKGLGLTSQECFNKVNEAVSHEIAFCMHTDEHAAHLKSNKSSLGCGHVAKAMSHENRKMYGVDPDELFMLVSKVKSRKAKVQNVVLKGDHVEEGVLIINSESKTVIPHNNGHMYFVYDKLRDAQFMKKLVEKMNIPGLEYEDFLKASNEQLNATLHLLAKGLPIYSIEINSHNISVSPIGNVK